MIFGKSTFICVVYFLYFIIKQLKSSKNSSKLKYRSKHICRYRGCVLQTVYFILAGGVVFLRIFKKLISSKSLKLKLPKM
jgi:hypothetical protein